jgi:ATP-dependent RNA helicase DDX41
MIGIAFTGSGKSFVFIIPVVLLALSEERNIPLESGEGPFAIIIVPSRELAVQIHESINYFIKYFLREKEPDIRSVLCIGGIDIKYQIEEIQKGCHILTGTPGRLSDLLEKRKLNCDMCKLLVLDEADRLLDMGFDEEVRKVMEKFKYPKQLLLFSSTMPKKIQDFAKQSLFKPIVINIGRAGSVNLNLIQDIEFVKDESKLIQILDTLQKTPPPVLIFCENKNDVEEIHEYLVLKGIDVCSMHGDKDQEERHQAIREFREGLKDVLVATDIVSKGIDFPDIEHVINYDMPKEVNLIKLFFKVSRLKIMY